MAAVAMLLGKDYEETFSLLHEPGKDSKDSKHGWRTNIPGATAIKLLKRVGIKSHYTTLRKFNTLRRHYNGRHVLIIIRWSFSPNMCHTIVFDGDDVKFIDPSYADEPNRFTLRNLEAQLDSVIVIDKLPKETTNELPRSDSADRAARGEDGLGQDSVHSNGQAPVLSSP